MEILSTTVATATTANKDRPWYFRTETIVATSVAVAVIFCCSVLLVFRCICAKRRKQYEFGFVEADEEERQQLRNEKMNLISRRSRVLAPTSNNRASVSQSNSTSSGYEMGEVDLQTSLNKLLHNVNEGLRGTDLSVERPDPDLSNQNVKCFIARNTTNARFTIAVTFDRKKVIENENEKSAFLQVMRAVKGCDYIYPLTSIDYSVAHTRCTTIRPYPQLGTLDIFLTKYGALSNFQISLFGRQILLALSHLDKMGFPINKFHFPPFDIVVTQNNQIRDKEASYICGLARLENTFLSPLTPLRLAHTSIVQQEYHILSFGHFLFDIATRSSEPLRDLSELDAISNAPQIHQVLTSIFNGSEKLSIQTLLNHALFSNDAVRKYDAPLNNPQSTETLGKRVKLFLSKVQDTKKYKKLQQEKAVNRSSTVLSQPVQSTSSSSASVATPRTTTTTTTSAPPPPPPPTKSAPPPPIAPPPSISAPPPQTGRAGLLDEIRRGTKLTFKGS